MGGITFVAANKEKVSVSNFGYQPVKCNWATREQMTLNATSKIHLTCFTHFLFRVNRKVSCQPECLDKCGKERAEVGGWGVKTLCHLVLLPVTN